MPGTSASAWATPMPIATGNVTSSTPLVEPAPVVRQPQDHGTDDQHDRDETRLADGRLDEVVQQEPGQRGRDGRRDQQPGQPPVGIASRTSGRGWSPDRPAPGGPSPPGSRPAAPAACPRWSITLNASEVMNGSVQPNRNGTMIRCPDDETGRNSVSPCTIPMISAWMIVSISPTDGCRIRALAA